MPYKQVNPTVDYTVRSLCVKAYPLHKKGCPNLGKKAGCPPHCPTIEEVLDFSKPIYVVWNVFPIGEHSVRMLELHPHWSDRQCYCCLYWQPKARKQLKQEIVQALRGIVSSSALKVVPNPEGAGINVTATMESVGVQLEWPPKEWACQVALIGSPKKKCSKSTLNPI